MNVVYIIWKFYSPTKFKNMGGAEKQLLLLLEEIYRRKEIQAQVITKKHSKDLSKELFHNIKINRITSTNIPFISMIIFSFLTFMELIRCHKKKKLDVIHIYLSDIFLFSVKFFSILFKVPIIVRLASVELNPYQSKGLWRINRILVCKAIFSLSKYQILQVLNKNTYLLAKKKKKKSFPIYLIPNCTLSPKLERNYSHLSNKIIYIGAMRYSKRKVLFETKNLIFLIDAFKIVHKSLPALKLILVGDGNYRKDLEEYVIHNQLQNVIKFEGYQLQITKYFLNADIFINPSHHEGMPNTVLEAMSFGLYCLCSDIDVHREIIGNNQFGTLFNRFIPKELAKHIINFYNSPKLQNLCIEKASLGRNRIKMDFNFENHKNQIINLYKNLDSVNF